MQTNLHAEGLTLFLYVQIRISRRHFWCWTTVHSVHGAPTGDTLGYLCRVGRCCCREWRATNHICFFRAAALDCLSSFQTKHTLFARPASCSSGACVDRSSVFCPWFLPACWYSARSQDGRSLYTKHAASFCLHRIYVCMITNITHPTQHVITPKISQWIHSFR